MTSPMCTLPVCLFADQPCIYISDAPQIDGIPYKYTIAGAVAKNLISAGSETLESANSNQHQIFCARRMQEASGFYNERARTL